LSIEVAVAAIRFQRFLRLGAAFTIELQGENAMNCDTRTRLAAVLFLAATLAAGNAQALPFTGLVIFGDSLSDSGNNAIVLSPNVTPVPISGNTFIPDFPYASGHYTNGQVWAQRFASALGLSATPVLAGGTDFAFAGARTGPLNPNGLLDPNTFPPNVRDAGGSVSWANWRCSTQ
jgi:phospholipase/lecithinase/hemolysin